MIAIQTVASALIHHFISVLLLAAVQSASSGSRFLTILKDLYSTLPGYLAGAAIVAAIRIGLHLSGGRYEVVLPLVVIAAPIGMLVLREQKLKRELVERNDALETLLKSTVEAFALAIDAKDRYTQEHIGRVRKLAVAIARRLGLSEADVQAIEIGAALHDVGKLGIPEHILNKPGRLTDDEFTLVKKHAEIGARILEPVNFPGPVMGVVKHHHEKWDGSGYPDGLVGQDIPLGGRILAVADVYDALTSDRPYREGWTHERALLHIQDTTGTHFDPSVVAAFEQVIIENPSLAAVTVRPDAVSTEVATAINRASFEYTAIFEVSQVLSTIRDVRETTDMIAERIRILFQADTCAIILRSGSIARAVSVSGMNSDFFNAARIDRKSGPTFKTIESGVGFVGDYDSTDLMLQAATAAWFVPRTAIVAPMEVNGRVVGTINLYHQRVGGFDDEDLRILTNVGGFVARGIDNATELEEHRESAITDVLTGLRNARYFTTVVERAVVRAEASSVPFSILMLDLDNFKKINDSFGHVFGNEVLKSLGNTVDSVLRDKDVVARYAGDEFVVLLPDTDKSSAKHIAQRLSAAISEMSLTHIGETTQRVSVSASIGVAMFPEHGNDLESLLHHADCAMYESKAGKRIAKPTTHVPASVKQAA
jgi:diguanylate cyclase (GGDEF)-like protein/putative nucleotidyltransferase with HDIG domain